MARKSAALFSKCRYTVGLATCAAWARSSIEVLRYPYRVKSSSAASTIAFGLAELPLAPALLFLTFFIHITSNQTKYTTIGYSVYLEWRVCAYYGYQKIYTFNLCFFFCFFF